MTAEHPVKTRKMLIETALPLEAINAASAREKSIRHGHPSTLHLWWARRPLAAARAVIFAQMVIDPSDLTEDFPTEAAQDAERERLFQLLSELVKWESTTNEQILERARVEIRRSWRVICSDNRGHPRASELFNPDKLPGFHDPFAGGGALPLEAQRLGLESYATDLNPVAVLINKAMIEIPPKFAGKPPVNPDAREEKSLIAREWKGAQGLAEDVRYYGQWMRDEAAKRLGHLYPPIEVTAEMARERPDLKPYVGEKLTVIAWIWARTVKSPNPAFAAVDVPLASTFSLSTKPGREAYIEPVIEGGGYRFKVRIGKPVDAASAKRGTKLSRGANFECLMSKTPITSEHIHREANAGRMSARLMAIVAEGARGRIYLDPSAVQQDGSKLALPVWKPDLPMPDNPRWFSPPLYGLRSYGDLFTERQLTALTTLSDLVGEAIRKVRMDAALAHCREDDCSLEHGGSGASAYADSIGLYLAFAVDKVAEGSTTLCVWSPLPTKLHVVSTFGRQALPMTWDFAESNIFADSSGNFARMSELVANVIARQHSSVVAGGEAGQLDAAQITLPRPRVVSTDPPYYDNIGYADLSDFFYVWLRRALKNVLPGLFTTLSVPKAEELVATPYRHGGNIEAEKFFLAGMTSAMRCLAKQSLGVYPVTIYYAFKQSESSTTEGTTNTGWDTFLEAVICAGFGISGTWPVRTERAGGFRNKDQNALASSIVLVCVPRSVSAPQGTRQSFVRALDAKLPQSLRALQLGGVAPVDMAQAAIGPGMAIFTQYSVVLEADGSRMPVRAALVLINKALARLGDPDSTDTDDDTRWAVSWFEQNCFDAGEFGQAEVLAGAKNVGINGLVEAGIVHSRAGKVRLMKREELNGGDPMSYDPRDDDNVSIWEALQHLVHRHSQGGSTAAGELLRALPGMEDQIKDLAYRLYGVCERKKWAQEAMVYNALVAEWSDIVAASVGASSASVELAEAGLFGEHDDDSTDE